MNALWNFRNSIDASCIHEAAHSVIVKIHGGDIESRVFPNEFGGWDGHGEYDLKPWRAIWYFLDGNLERVPPQHINALIGLAGEIGEYIESNQRSGALPITAANIIAHIEVLLKLGEVSASDLTLMGQDWREHVSETTYLLISNWERVQATAQLLFTVARVEFRPLEITAQSNKSRCANAGTPYT